MRLLIEDQRGQSRIVYPRGTGGGGVRVGETNLPAGSERRLSLIVTKDAAGAFLLADPGTYILRVEHEPTGVQSNQIKLKVAAPAGEDADALREFRSLTAMFDGTLDPTSGPVAATFVTKYPHSPYAQWLKVQLYTRAPWYAVHDWDKEEVIWREQMPKERRQMIGSENARKVLTVVERDDWGMFEPERLALIAQLRLNLR